MKRFGLVCLLAVLACVVWLSSAQAQVPTQDYASPGGGSIGSCTAAAPCSLTTAIGQISTVTGIVSCIGGGNYVSNTTAFLSFTIDCPGAVLASRDGPAITLTGNSTQVVILRNLTFEGTSSSTAPFIKVQGGATLIIENCRFQNSSTTLITSNAIAIQFTPNSPAAQLTIRDTVFANNGIAPGTGGGLQVAPAPGGSASVALEHVAFDYNVTSMVLSGAVNATMINSTVKASQSNGILVGSGTTLLIKDSTLEYNVGAAVSVASGGTLHLSNNDIRANQIGIKNSGGQVLSYKNNRIFGNGSTATLGTIAGGQ